MEGEGAKDDGSEGDFLRRRGMGATLPVGWKHMPAPSQTVRLKIFEQIMDRYRKEEQESAERAARAEERKNVEEKIAWHKEQIADCEAKVQSFNARKAELDLEKSRLFAELKEVVAKDKAQKAALEERASNAVLFSQILQSQSKDTQDSMMDSQNAQGSAGGSGSTYNAQSLGSHLRNAQPSPVNKNSQSRRPSDAFWPHKCREKRESRKCRSRSRDRKNLLTNSFKSKLLSDRSREHSLEDVAPKHILYSTENGSTYARRSIQSKNLPRETEKERPASCSWSTRNTASHAANEKRKSSRYNDEGSWLAGPRKDSFVGTRTSLTPTLEIAIGSLLRLHEEDCSLGERRNESPEELTKSPSQSPNEPWYGFTPQSEEEPQQEEFMCPKAPTPRLFTAPCKANGTCEVNIAPHNALTYEPYTPAASPPTGQHSPFAPQTQTWLASSFYNPPLQPSGLVFPSPFVQANMQLAYGLIRY